MDLTDPTLTAEQIAEETMIEEAEEYFFGFPLDEAAWRRNGRLHAAKDAEIAALRDRLARAEAREREVAGALQRDIERIAHDMRLYYDGWFETMQRDRLAIADPMIDICRPISDWMLRLDNLARIVPLAFVTPPGIADDGDTGIPDDIAAIIDAAWEIPPGAQERIWARFMALLAAEEPNHPWVRAATEGEPSNG